MWEPITSVGACPICGSLPNRWELAKSVGAALSHHCHFRKHNYVLPFNGSYPENTSFQMTRCSLTTFQGPGSLTISGLFTKTY
jgi:hypothetical protein